MAKGVRMAQDGGRVRVELQLAVHSPAAISQVGGEQGPVAAYLDRAKVEPDAIDVIVDEIGPA
jgi:hypothetical protein